MSILYDNIVVFVIALVSCVYAWLYGGIVASALVPVMPWLWALLLEVMICFPQKRGIETTYEARERVWRDCLKDPLTWVTVGFLLLLQIPFLNKGLCPLCDYAQIALGAEPEPQLKFLPWCVNRLNHLNVVMWFVPSLTAMLAVKHSLARRGKRMLLEIIIWNGFLLALLGFVQQVAGAEAPLWGEFSRSGTAYFFSTFGYPNMGGDYFTTLFALAVGMWRWNYDALREEEHNEEKRGSAKKGPGSFWAKHYLLIPAIVFFFAALTTLSRAAIILVTLMAIIFFMHTFMTIFKSISRAKRAKASAACLIALIGIALSTILFMPDDLQSEVDTLNTSAVLDRVTGKGQYHVRVATEVWKDAPIFGVGGWGYKHLCIPKMTPEELKNIQSVGGINVHNDYLQFLAEHGIVGFGCLVALVVLLLWPLGAKWRLLIDTVRFTPVKKQPPRPLSVFVLPPPVFCILIAATGTLIHAFADCPLRSPAVLSLFFIELAAMDGFLPHIEEVPKEEKEEKHHHHHHHHHHSHANS